MGKMMYISEKTMDAISFASAQVSDDLEGAEDEGYVESANTCLSNIFKLEKKFYNKK